MRKRLQLSFTLWLAQREKMETLRQKGSKLFFSLRTNTCHQEDLASEVCSKCDVVHKQGKIIPVSSPDQPAAVYASGKPTTTKRNRSRARVVFSKRSRSQVIQIDINWGNYLVSYFKSGQTGAQRRKLHGRNCFAFSLKQYNKLFNVKTTG